MNKFVLLGVAVLCFAAAARAAEGDLQIDGCTVPRPAEGFVWKKVSETPAKDQQPKTLVYEATKPDSVAKVILTFEQVVADSTAKRRVRVRTDYRTMYAALKDQGYTDIRASDPPMDPPIADLVGFLFSGTDKQGKPGSMMGVLYFGKNVYHFQITSPSETEARALARVGDNIKEPS